MSEVKVNKISPRTNCGTTTLGDSGDTFTIPAGVTITNNGTQTGFGREGSVNWQTSIKTSTFTAANGEGYFVNTTSGAVTVNLPAGSVGAIVSIKDYAQTFDTNNCTISADGSEKIENLTEDLVLDTEGIAVTLVYADATRGWQVVNSNEVTNVIKFVTATGGTITTCGDFKIHTFTGPGTFSVTCGGNSAGSNTVDYLVVAGGAAGGCMSGCSATVGGGGGAGGHRFSASTYTAPPTSAPLAGSALPVSIQCYPVTVGAGSARARPPVNGSNSSFSTIASAGGGNAGGAGCNPRAGGSGGGGSAGGGGQPGGTGNSPPVTPSQGNDGGNGVAPKRGGGGGGAIAAGSPGPSGGTGGNGVELNITGSPVTKGGGGGGANNGGAAGGSGGGGAGSPGPTNNGVAATVNTGGGGGGSGHCGGTSGNGGSGIVVIRYKFQ